MSKFQHIDVVSVCSTDPTQLFSLFKCLAIDVYISEEKLVHCHSLINLHKLAENSPHLTIIILQNPSRGPKI